MLTGSSTRGHKAKKYVFARAHANLLYDYYASEAHTGGVNAVLVGNDFPELGSDLVAALAALDMNDFTHCGKER